ncbi:40s ribosomal protein s5-1 [Hordeum vulgare]|nr:40s ribosomal protein s5-1 [Hordeum vulgare]
MRIPSSCKDKFFEKVINPYLSEVMKHPQAIEMHEGVLHIHDVQEPMKERSEKAKFTVVEQEIFKCQGMVECGLSTNYSMITYFIHENKLETRNVGEALFNFKSGLNISKFKSLSSNTKTVSMNQGLRG